MFIVEDSTMTMKCRTVIKVAFFYFNLYLCVMLDSFSDAGEACMLHLKIGKLTIVKSRSSCLSNIFQCKYSSRLISRLI